jgi:Zn-dependent M28 family amino/carboxypeptidase
MRMRNRFSCVMGGVAVLLTGSSLPAQMSGGGADVRRAAESITMADLREHMEVLAHDSMRGRDTPSPELMETARYVERQFRSSGLEPGLAEGYLQMYPLTRMRPAASGEQQLKIDGPAGSREFVWGEEFFAQHTSAMADASGSLVGIASPDERKTAAGEIAVIRVSSANLRQVFGGGLRESLAAARPAGLVVVLDVPDQFFQLLRGFLSGERISYGRLEDDGPPVVFVSQAALPGELAAQLTRGGSVPDGWSASLRTESEAAVIEAPNTVGVLVGSDRRLRDEFVLFTAHMDHVGVGGPVDGDSIYNGADDDASGTVTIIELAEAFAALESRPRRSLVFMAVSGEEKGLLGSRWYSEHPAFPIERTVANINIDMVGRNWPDTIVAIGKDESSLGPLVERVSAEHPELNMAVIDDLWPEESFYTRSDHYNFARKGVPVLFFFNGTHEDYHRASDEADKIDYEKMSRIGRLVFYLGLEVANGDEPPSWDPKAYERVVETPRS